MQPRRSLRLAVGALVLALPLLGGCGFDKATDRPYTPAAGVNDQEGDVDVLSAVVVSAQPGSGTFVAALANESATKDAELQSVAGSGATAGLTVSSVSGIDVPPRGAVNLVDESPITVQGDFGAGDFLELTLTFASGGTATMDVPVVYACDEFSGLDSSASSSPSSSASSSPSSSASSSPSSSPSESESPSESSSSGSSTSGEPYDCDTVLEEG